MSIRSDLLLACILGNRWKASSAPAAGVTVSAVVGPPSNYDSRHNVESIWYSITNLTAANATVAVQVRSSSQTGSVIASVEHIVLPGTSANPQLTNMQLVAKRGMGLVFTTSTVAASVAARINAEGWTEDVATSGGTFDETYIRSLSPAAWFRFGLGITTVTGVSQWNDQSGNARHLSQATGAAQPALQADGSILFDGVDDFMQTGSFTLNQPETFYFLCSPVSWTLNDSFADGFGGASGFLQSGASPQVAAAAGTASALISAPLGTYAVFTAVFNGVSGSFQLNNSAPTVENLGAGNAGGLTLGSTRAPGNFANIQVKEVIIFSDAHDATTRGRVISYLTKLGKLP